MDFLALPSEIQELVYRKLHVTDRVKLSMALPRNTKVQVKPRVAEKKLGVLAKAVKRRRIASLSDAMKCFITTCDPTDPTITEMTEVFPETRLLAEQQSTVFQTVAEKIKSGDIASLAGLTDEKLLEDVKIQVEIYKSNPITFQELMNIRIFKEWIVEWQYQVYSNLYNYANSDLLDFIHDYSCNLYDWDVAALKASVRRTYYNPAVKASSMFSRTPCRDLLLKHIPYTAEELESLWLACMERMDIDAAQDIDAQRAHHPIL